MPLTSWGEIDPSRFRKEETFPDAYFFLFKVVAKNA